MALHISAKLVAVGLALAALITAFSLPQSDGLSLEVRPRVELHHSPRAINSLAVSSSYGPILNPRLVLRATGYNSHVSQTDATPYITATGVKTRFGIIAASRDLLGSDLPYGSLVRIRDLGGFYSGRGRGQYQSLLDGQGIFIVEDTMHPRKRQQVDLWFPEYATAVSWGVRRVEVEVIRYGRDGPEQLRAAQGNGNTFVGSPRFVVDHVD